MQIYDDRKEALAIVAFTEMHVAI